MVTASLLTDPDRLVWMIGTPSCEDVEDFLDTVDERPEFPFDSVKDCMSFGCRFSRGACLKQN